MRAATASESRPLITTGRTPRSRAHSKARPSRTQKLRVSPVRENPITPSVSVPSTSRNSTLIGVASGTADTGGRLLDGLVHAHRFVQERGGARERQLCGGI